ncbi:uncharacterized protein LOC117319839 [Pecten maximus]|uniref:uncharacterized protein LOC117319839 n=1 Tax=Pecten maximus TaxID=6579 RepID=UPI001458DC89|nr:uncharacterized protein LOC117319839 [Pecten maximus]
MVEMVSKELTRLLDQRFDSRSVDFNVVYSDTSASLSHGVLFALCLNKSNIVTSIQDALQETKGRRDTFVLVMHHTAIENLPHMTPTRTRVARSNIELQLEEIIDMAFSSDNGLYECDLNNVAVDKIESIMKRF